MCFAPFRSQLHHIAFFPLFLEVWIAWRWIRNFAWKRRVVVNIWDNLPYSIPWDSNPQSTKIPVLVGLSQIYLYCLQQTLFQHRTHGDEKCSKNEPLSYLCVLFDKKYTILREWDIFLDEGKIRRLSLFLFLNLKLKLIKKAKCEVLTFNCIGIVIV